MSCGDLSGAIWLRRGRLADPSSLCVCYVTLVILVTFLIAGTKQLNGRRIYFPGVFSPECERVGDEAVASRLEAKNEEERDPGIQVAFKGPRTRT